MIVKYIQICDECPFCDQDSDECVVEERREIDTLDTPPSWCPLRNDAVLIHIHDDTPLPKEDDDREDKEADDD